MRGERAAGTAGGVAGVAGGMAGLVNALLPGLNHALEKGDVGRSGTESEQKSAAHFWIQDCRNGWNGKIALASPEPCPREGRGRQRWNEEGIRGAISADTHIG